MATQRTLSEPVEGPARRRRRDADPVSRVLGVLALVLAAFSTYMQFFHVRHSFSAHILQETPTPEANLIAIVSNSGNQPEVLQQGFLVAAVKWGAGELVVRSNSLEPQVVQAGAKVVLRVPTTMQSLLGQLPSDLQAGSVVKVKAVTVAISASGAPVMGATSFATVITLGRRGYSFHITGATIDLLHPVGE